MGVLFGRRSKIGAQLTGHVLLQQQQSIEVERHPCSTAVWMDAGAYPCVPFLLLDSLCGHLGKESDYVGAAVVWERGALHPPSLDPLKQSTRVLPY